MAAGFYTAKETDSYQYRIRDYLKNNLGFSVSLDGFWKAGATVTSLALPNVQKVIAMKPDLISIEYGTNEQDTTNPYYATPEQFKTNLTQLVTQLRSALPKARIVLLTPWQSTTPAPYRQVVQAVGAANSGSVVDISSVWHNQANISSKTTQSWQGTGDGYHPSSQGNLAIARLMVKAIDKIYVH